MPTITVITPVHTGGDAYLTDTYKTLAVQCLPHGWRLQWVVQEDGATGSPLAKLPDEPWISKGTGRQGGAARARTLALTRAEGILLRTLDADDLLPDAQVLARDIEVFRQHPEIAWVACPCLDLMPDGSLVAGPYDPPAGPLEPRTLIDGLLDDCQFPIMGTSVTLYTELVRALGAWPALPAAEDMALALNAEAVANGWMQSKPGELYRKHSAQSTKEPAYADIEERNVRIKALVDQAEALHRTGWRWTPKQTAADTV